MAVEEAYNKIVDRHTRRTTKPTYEYLSPTKASLYGLMVRFNDHEETKTTI